MNKVLIQSIYKSFAKTEVLKGIDLEIRQGEFFFLLGPSGCGKTTLLRILAGFERPDRGSVLFDGTDMTAVPPQNRNTSMVFQSYALWPHMTVFENIAYGLENRRVAADEIKKRVADVLALVRMSEYAKRLPNQLSGGQQQRIALARAVVVNPQLLLLDEPLSNLDARLRADMRIELLRVHRQTGVTTVYVTHDQSEALSLADRIGYLDEGRLIQVGTPRELYNAPATINAARFLGSANLIPGTVGSCDGDGAIVDTPAGRLNGRFASPQGRKPGESVSCFFRPERMSTAPGKVNRLSAKVTACMYEGGHERLYLESNGAAFEALVPAPAEPTRIGTEITLGIAPDDVRIFN